MNDENLFWKLAAAVATVAILTMGGCTTYRSARFYDAVNNGADPMELSCANRVGEREQHICTLVAQRGRK